MAGKKCGLKASQSILVAYDGSKCGKKALDQAISLADACGSTLHLLHVIGINDEYMALGIGLEEKLNKEAVALVGQAMKKIAKAGVKADSVIVHEEQPFRAIISEAAKRKANLIVLGTHGRTGLPKILMGSVAQRVIGNAICPVLVVPA
jgi:nucleotide-binding universal stress UspA family protein